MTSGAYSPPVAQPLRLAQWRTRLRAFSAQRRLPLWMALVGVCAGLPSLWLGFVADDFIHRQMLLTLTWREQLWGLFAFVHPQARLSLSQINQQVGTVPWWAAADLKIAFYRPLAVLTHWLDYRLWPDAPALMHLQNLLWYGGCCGLATLLYRRLLAPGWIVGPVALFFALDVGHIAAVSWIANRNALLALFFGLGTLLAHHQWRLHGRRRVLLLARVAYILTLLSAESGIATLFYLLAYALFLDDRSWPARLRSMFPYVFVSAMWLFNFIRLDYGASGSGFYLSPFDAPAAFVAAVVERGPLLFLSQWLGLMPAPYNLLRADVALAVWLGALALSGGLLALLWPTLRRHPTARFWALGMALSIVPACTIRLLSGRLLLFASIGTLALLGIFLADVAERARGEGWHALRRRTGWALAGLHSAVPLLLIPLVVVVTGNSQRQMEALVRIGPLPPDAQVQILNAPSPFHFIYLPGLRFARGQNQPDALRLLAPAYGDVTMQRVAERVFVVEAAHGFAPPPATTPQPPVDVSYLYQHMATFFVAGGGAAQSPQTAAGMAVTPLSSAAGGPASARFELPASSAPQVWLYWDWPSQTYRPLALPPVGESVSVAGP